MKTICNNSPIRLSNWEETQVAKITDMGIDPYWKNFVTDENRLYGSAKPLCLCSDTSVYDQINDEYANPIVVEDGELVKLEDNGKVYRLKCMGFNGKYAYLSDLLHFELCK